MKEIILFVFVIIVFLILFIGSTKIQFEKKEEKKEEEKKADEKNKITGSNDVDNFNATLDLLHKYANGKK